MTSVATIPMPVYRMAVPLAGAAPSPPSTPAVPSPDSPGIDPVALGVLPDTVSPSAAMGIMEKARQAPMVTPALTTLEQARKNLAALDARTVDHDWHKSQAMSQYGIFALCIPPVAAMYFLPKLGLTGMGAVVGLVAGIFLPPALALWGVKRLGEGRAREAEAALEVEKLAARVGVDRQQKAVDGLVRTEMQRLWKEELDRLQAMADCQPDGAGKVTATETQVQLGSVRVSKRRADGEA